MTHKQISRLSLFSGYINPLNIYKKTPPLYLTIPAIILVLILALPIIYLSIRTFDATNAAWEMLFSMRSLQTLGRSLLLMLTVTTISALIALPLAWITARTDLPLSKMWTILATLPLVIPSFIGAYLFN